MPRAPYDPERRHGYYKTYKATPGGAEAHRRSSDKANAADKQRRAEARPPRLTKEERKAQRDAENAAKEAAQRESREKFAESFRQRHNVQPAPAPKPKAPRAPPPRTLPFLLRRNRGEEMTREPYVPQGNVDRAAQNREMVARMREQESEKKPHPWWRKIGGQ